MTYKSRAGQLVIPITASVPYDVTAEVVTIAAGAAGSVVDFFIARKPILDSHKSWIGGDGDSGLALTSTAFTNEVPAGTEDANLSNGDYWVDYLTGRCRGKKADNSVSATATYSVLLEGLAAGGTIFGDMLFMGDVTVNGDFNFGDVGTDILTIAGYIRGTATGLGYVSIGNTATSHALAAVNDLMVGGKIESNGMIYADGGLEMGNNINLNDYKIYNGYAEFEKVSASGGSSITSTVTSLGLGAAEQLGAISGTITGSESDDSTSTLYGISMDYVAPTASSTLVDGGFEIWTNPTTLTNWSFLNPIGAGTPSVNRESTIKQSGTYSARLDSDASGNWGAIEQVQSGLVVGDTYSVTVYGRTATAGKGHILFFNDAYADATQIWNHTTSSWDALTGPEPANPDYYYEFGTTTSFVNFTSASNITAPASGNINIAFGGPIDVAGVDSIYIDVATFKKDFAGTRYTAFMSSRGDWGSDYVSVDKNMRIESLNVAGTQIDGYTLNIHGGDAFVGGGGNAANVIISAGNGDGTGNNGILQLNGGDAGSGTAGFVTTDTAVAPSTTRSLTNTSLQVKNILEVLGKSYFDNDMAILDDKAIILGTGSDASILFDAGTQTNDALVIKLPTANQSIIFASMQNYQNYGFGNNTHPTTYWKSNDTNNNKYGYAQYDGNNMILGSGLGGFVLRPYNGNFIGQNLTGAGVKFLMFNSTSGSGATDGAYFGFGDWDTAAGVTVWNFENAGMRFGVNNTQALFIDKNTYVHIGATALTPLAPLHVGDGTTISSVDSSILVSRVINTGTGNAHGYSDSTIVARTGSIGYNSYDGRITVNGTTNYDHIISFQDAPTINFTGTMANLYGGSSIPTLTNGSITNRYGWLTKEVAGVGGSILAQYGLYVEALTRATTNWAVYTAGTTASYFGGSVGIGTTAKLTSLQVALTSANDGIFAQNTSANANMYVGESGGPTGNTGVITWNYTNKYLAIGTQHDSSDYSGLINIKDTYVGIGTADFDGTPAIGKLIIKGTTNDGTTNILVGRDSDEANVFYVDTNGGVALTAMLTNWTNAGITVADLGSITTVDINGGTIDGVTIGGSTAGAITGTTITANTGIVPDANDGAYLGQAGTAFSDLFLASGGVINWDSGDVTITHSADTLALAGATSYTFDSTVTLGGGQIVNTTVVNAATYDLVATDYILHVTYTGTGACAIDLKTAQTVDGRVVIIKDAGGNATTNNITVTTEGAQTIDGAATAVISTNYDSITLYCDGSNWFII